MPEKPKKPKKKIESVTIRPDTASDLGKNSISRTELDLALWQSFTKDIVPLKDQGLYSIKSDVSSDIEPALRASRKIKPKFTRTLLSEVLIKDIVSTSFIPASPPKGASIDRAYDQKFRKGLLPVDGRLDLHGYSVDVAFGKFLDFMGRHIGLGSRCLLVITGKGRDRETGLEIGAIRSEFPKWLTLAHISVSIFSSCQAPAHMGGKGAFLILLRKKK
ncbi:MAG TPA: Smr/MutS family protein [Alphaproteobacteria bacterium]|nr:Smr/MutS family protein [Alphaproteobacteria bacterium]HOO50552.1 Smr/MutS family protein [Alphaproteobacteria bacterium]